LVLMLGVPQPQLDTLTGKARRKQPTEGAIHLFAEFASS
jgi:hypothetical protein